MKTKLKYDLHKVGAHTQKALVLIHGWQGDKNSMLPLIKSLNIMDISYYLLEAPFKVLDGKGYSWSYEKSDGSWEIEKPKALLLEFFTKLFNIYNSKDIYVLGFSQGGLVCLEFVLFLEKQLAGVFPISGFFRNPKSLEHRFHISQKDTPIIIGHGKSDDVVPSQSSQIAYQQLLNQGANVELILYNGKHRIGVDITSRIIKEVNNHGI
jgi:phospholipase/carboxylesterase